MKPTFFSSSVKLRAWLAKNHATQKELLVGFHKTHTRKPSITWPESVDEALCFGWIDGVRRSIDEHAYSIRFTPRKRTSIWSANNVARVAELTKLGKMMPAGERAFAARTPERTGVYSFERNEAAKLSPTEEKALRADRKAAAFFDAQPPWYRRTAIHWVISPKRVETRERRFATLMKDSAAGRTIAPLTRTPRAKVKRQARSASPMRAHAPTTIDAYLANVKGPTRTALERLRKTIRAILPEATEHISYGMPAFRYGGRVVAGFAAATHGCSYYPFSGRTLRTLARELESYEQTKGALHFGADKPLAVALVRKLLLARIAE